MAKPKLLLGQRLQPKLACASGHPAFAANFSQGVHGITAIETIFSHEASVGAGLVRHWTQRVGVYMGQPGNCCHSQIISCSLAIIIAFPCEMIALPRKMIAFPRQRKNPSCPFRGSVVRYLSLSASHWPGVSQELLLDWYWRATKYKLNVYAWVGRLWYLGPGLTLAMTGYDPGCCWGVKPQ